MPSHSRLSLSVVLFSALIGALSTADTATATDLEFVGELHFTNDPGGCGGGPTGGSDVWGYTAPDGTEYAIMGVLEGVAVVRVPEMEVIDVIPGPANFDCYYHRDIKTYGHYAYITNEMVGTNEGLIILDLQFLPDHVEYVGSYPDFSITSHNLNIDTATGYAYLQNSGGVRIVSLADPVAPVDVKFISITGVHDVFAQNDRLYVSEGFTGKFSIWDVTDKQNPVRLCQKTIPNAGYSHNIWASADDRYFMTTEETTGKTTKMWDALDPTNPVLLGEWLGGNGLAHNTQLMGDFAFIAHYSYGISVVDISDPNAPVEVGHYDTYPAHDNAAFVGCWGAYPYTQSGYVYASDIEGDLVVLRWQSASSVPDLSATSALFQAFPNPSRAETTLRYRTEDASTVRLEVFSAAGERVREIAEGAVSAGMHEASWDGRDALGRDVPGGAYFLRLTVDGPQGFEATRKIVRTR
ncbi:MAG: choice-of-anchor B family protein [Candidatus Eisenbacteria bacterium]|nr:choice-of-anchor B family protein [Candidatus Eisenbacteria bacterium]